MANRCVWHVVPCAECKKAVYTKQNGGTPKLCPACNRNRKRVRDRAYGATMRARHQVVPRIERGSVVVLYDPQEIGGYDAGVVFPSYQATEMFKHASFSDGTRIKLNDEYYILQVRDGKTTKIKE